MQSVPRDNEPSATRAEADYLLISAMNAVTAGRIRDALSLAGIGVTETELGLEVCCQAMDCQALVESISLVLSPAERRDTRVATLALGDDRAAVHRAIFRARSVELLLGDMREGWFDKLLERRGIAIHLQPLVQYPPGRLHGYECLMRGQDVDGRLIPPSRILEAARRLEKTQLLDEHCRMAAMRRAAQVCAGSALTMFINFLPSSILNPHRTLETAMAELDRTGVRPAQVAFEVVETDRIHDRRQLVDVLRMFRKAGFKIALDDVGAGYSSLLSLASLRPDYIKIDGELVRRAATSALEAKIVADLAETARQNGIITVAEGIETERELRVVMDCGIRITQGYLHCRPQPEPLTPVQLEGVLARVAGVRGLKGGTRSGDCG